MPDRTLTAEEKRRISLIRFLLAMGVLFLHTLGGALAYAGYMAEQVGRPALHPSMLNVFLNRVLFRESRPVFFGLAALLLVTGLGPHLEGYWQKLRNRGRSLLAPYLLWNALAFVFLFACGSLLAKLGYSSKGFEVFHATWPQTLGYALGLYGNPVDGPMWFVRNLIVYVLVSPGLIWIARRYPYPLLASAVALCFCWEDKTFSFTDSLLYFTVGILAGVKPALLRFARRQDIRIVVAFGVLACLDTTAIYLRRDVWQFHVLTLLVGLPAVWVITGVLVRHDSVANLLSRLSTYSFLLFAAHGLLVGVVVRIILRKIPANTPWSVDVVGFVAGFLIIAIVLGLGIPFRRFLPRAFAFVTGGRLYSANPERAVVEAPASA